MSHRNDDLKGALFLLELLRLTPGRSKITVLKDWLSDGIKLIKKSQTQLAWSLDNITAVLVRCVG